MGIINEKEFKKLCNVKPSCACPKLHIVFSEYANAPEYLRRFISHIALSKSNKQIKDLRYAINNWEIIDKTKDKEIEELKKLIKLLGDTVERQEDEIRILSRFETERVKKLKHQLQTKEDDIFKEIGKYPVYVIARKGKRKEKTIYVKDLEWFKEIIKQHLKTKEGDDVK